MAHSDARVETGVELNGAPWTEMGARTVKELVSENAATTHGHGVGGIAIVTGALMTPSDCACAVDVAADAQSAEPFLAS